MNQFGLFLNHGAKRIRWISNNLLFPQKQIFLMFNEKDLNPTTIAGYRTAIADHLGPAGIEISDVLVLSSTD